MAYEYESARDQNDLMDIAHRILPRQDFLKIPGDDTRIDDQVEQCADANINFITYGESAYPYKLENAIGSQTPPILSLYGNEKLINETGVGFCGSRKASEKGIGVALDCAQQLARYGLVIIAGHAAGVDAAAHAAALKEGGATIFVAPEGILRFQLRKEVKEFINWERALVISEFAPGMRWAAHNAMTRNKTIIGLSAAMIVIEAGLKGGTIEAGLAALEMRHPVYAPVYDGAVGGGNNILIEKGVKRIFKSRSTQKADLSHLLSDVHNFKRDVHPASQERLF